MSEVVKILSYRSKYGKPILRLRCHLCLSFFEAQDRKTLDREKPCKECQKRIKARGTYGK